MTSRSLLPLSLALFAGVAAAQSTTVFPPGFENLEGSTRDVNGPLGQGVSRVQLIYDAGKMRVPNAAQIRRVGFRQDASFNTASVSHIVLMSARMNATTVDPSSASGTFASNYTGTPTTVFAQRNFTLPAFGAPPANPSPNIVWIPLDTPWQHDASKSLLVEFAVLANNNGNAAFTNTVDVAPFFSPQASFGTGCQTSTSTTPTLTSNSVALNQFWSLSLTNAPVNAPSVLMVGLSNTSWNGLPLPIDLGFIGAPGCAIRVSMDVMVVGQTSGPNMSVSFRIPNNPLFDGVSLYAQVGSFDPFANNFGFVTSNGRQGTFGALTKEAYIEAVGNATATTGSVRESYGLVTVFEH